MKSSTTTRRLSLLSLVSATSAMALEPFIETIAPPPSNAFALPATASAKMFRMNLTRLSANEFDPVQAAIQLGMKYGAGSRTGSASSAASLAKQLELAYLNNSMNGNSTSGASGELSLYADTPQPLPLKSN